MTKNTQPLLDDLNFVTKKLAILRNLNASPYSVSDMVSAFSEAMIGHQEGPLSVGPDDFTSTSLPAANTIQQTAASSDNSHISDVDFFREHLDFTGFFEATISEIIPMTEQETAELVSKNSFLDIFFPNRKYMTKAMKNNNMGGFFIGMIIVGLLMGLLMNSLSLSTGQSSSRFKDEGIKEQKNAKKMQKATAKIEANTLALPESMSHVSPKNNSLPSLFTSNFETTQDITVFVSDMIQYLISVVNQFQVTHNHAIGNLIKQVGAFHKTTTLYSQTTQDQKSLKAGVNVLSALHQEEGLFDAFLGQTTLPLLPNTLHQSLGNNTIDHKNNYLTTAAGILNQCQAYGFLLEKFLATDCVSNCTSTHDYIQETQGRIGQAMSVLNSMASSSEKSIKTLQTHLQTSLDNFENSSLEKAA